MDYTLIDDDYVYDHLAAAIEGRQKEHYHYNLDKVNFEKMLETLPEGEYKKYIQSRLVLLTK